MIAAASGAMLFQSLVPLIVGQIVDGPIRHHDTAGLWPLAGLALLFGLAEAALFFIRRYAMASAAIVLRSTSRRDLFAHVQRLPLSFHDRWPPGNLARSPLTCPRSGRFVGFAFVFLIAKPQQRGRRGGLLIHIHLGSGCSFCWR